MSGTVKPERSGWRDERISRRHRNWGVECSATDIDFTLIEYQFDKGNLESLKIAALIEYKHEKARPFITEENPPIQALALFAEKAEIPAFIVRYADDFSTFKIKAINSFAKKWCDEVKFYTEKEYIKFLYKLRGKDAPEEILKAANG